MILKCIEIGKIIKFQGIRLQVIPAVQKCRGCYFKKLSSCYSEVVGVCSRPWRDTEIIFRKYDINKKINLHVRKKS